MPLIRFPTVKGLVYTIDLSKIADRENPRTVEAPIRSTSGFSGSYTVEWGDGTKETFTTETWPTHTYAEGTGDTFHIIIRSATGRLPWISYNSGQANSTAPEKNISYATVSIDHYNGMMAYGNTNYGGWLMRNCANIRYIDTRLPGSHQWDNLYYFAGCHGTAAGGPGSLNQPVSSFCFDFVTLNTTMGGIFVRQQSLYGDIPQGFLDRCGNLTIVESMFQGCINITSIPSDLLDNCHGITSVRYIFSTCQRLTGSPYVFWKEDGSIDTDRFPELTADYATNAYTGCPIAIRNQVPTAYGGTMTVG